MRHGLAHRGRLRFAVRVRYGLLQTGRHAFYFESCCHCSRYAVFPGCGVCVRLTLRPLVLLFNDAFSSRVLVAGVELPVSYRAVGYGGASECVVGASAAEIPPHNPSVAA